MIPQKSLFRCYLQKAFLVLLLKIVSDAISENVFWCRYLYKNAISKYFVIHHCTLLRIQQISINEVGRARYYNLKINLISSKLLTTRMW